MNRWESGHSKASARALAALAELEAAANGRGSAPPEAAVAPPLPAAQSSFVGRERELAELGSMLGRVRLVNLTGPGGTGKTRLAVELARRWLSAFGPALVSDLQWWTGLTAGQVKQALAQLDVTEVDLDGSPGVMLAAEVPDGNVAHNGGFSEPTVVEVTKPVPLARVVAGHVDDLLAVSDIAKAVAALPAADAGDDDAGLELEHVLEQQHLVEQQQLDELEQQLDGLEQLLEHRLSR